MPPTPNSRLSLCVAALVALLAHPAVARMEQFGAPDLGASAAANQPDRWTGCLEYVSARQLTLRLNDGRVIALRFGAGGPAPQTLAAGRRVGDAVAVSTRLLPESPLPLIRNLQTGAAVTPAEHAAALVSPAWREPGNLLPPPAPPGVAPAPPPAASSAVESARDAVLDYVARMPNYLADEFSTRYTMARNPGGAVQWQQLDTIATLLSWDGNHEARDHILHNGKPWPEPYGALLPFVWYGGYSGRLKAVFGRDCPNTFSPGGESMAGGKRRTVFKFHAAPDGCMGKIQLGYMAFYPGSEGSVELDADTGALYRLEEAFTGLPPSFPLLSASDITTWASTAIGDKQYLLPSNSVATFELPGRQGFRIQADYKNYRKFGATTTITIPGIPHS